MIAKRLRRLHETLIPPSVGVGIGPYIWLFYCAFLFFPLWFGNADVEVIRWTLVTLPIFLFLYFMGFRCVNNDLLLVVAAIVLLGVALSAHNPGGMTYFIYASSFAAFWGPPRRAAWLIAAVAATYVATWWVIGLPVQYLVLTIILILMTGVGNMVMLHIDRQNKELRASREQIERLGALNERERIARDLHDILGHTLSSITLKSALASRLITQDPDRAASEMREVEAISREALQQARSAVSGYRTTSVADEINKAQDLLVAHGMRVMVRQPDRPSVSAEYDNIAGLILREAVTNIVRHSTADTVEIVVANRSDSLTLTVSDNGSIDAIRPGNGISGMRERAESVGGALEIRTRNGCQVSATLPFTGDDSVAGSSLEIAS